jgi:hypothetical protein
MLLEEKESPLDCDNLLLTLLLSLVPIGRLEEGEQKGTKGNLE